MTSPTRAGDRDRESTATLLGQALAEGYLDLPEYENRLQTAFTAQTADDLRALTTDLPVAAMRRIVGSAVEGAVALARSAVPETVPRADAPPGGPRSGAACSSISRGTSPWSSSC